MTKLIGIGGPGDAPNDNFDLIASDRWLGRRLLVIKPGVIVADQKIAKLADGKGVLDLFGEAGDGVEAKMFVAAPPAGRYRLALVQLLMRDCQNEVSADPQYAKPLGQHAAGIG